MAPIAMPAISPVERGVLLRGGGSENKIGGLDDEVGVVTVPDGSAEADEVPVVVCDVDAGGVVDDEEEAAVLLGVSKLCKSNFQAVAEGDAADREENVSLERAGERLESGFSGAQQMLIWFFTWVHSSLKGESALDDSGRFSIV